MKIGLHVEDISEQPVGDYELVDFNNLGDVHNASCEEIFIGDSLDYFENRQEAFSYVLSKLKYGGVATITGIDLLSVCSLRKAFKITDDQAKEMLYSKRRSVSSMSECLKYLKSSGMQVSLKRIDGARYCIKFRRPEPNED